MRKLASAEEEKVSWRFRRKKLCGIVQRIGRGRGGEVEVRESNLLCNIRNVNQRLSREKNVKDGRWDDGIER